MYSSEFIIGSCIVVVSIRSWSTVASKVYAACLVTEQVLIILVGHWHLEASLSSQCTLALTLVVKIAVSPEVVGPQ